MNDRFKTRIWDKKEKQMHYNDFVITATGFATKCEVSEYANTFLINQTDLGLDNNCVKMQCTGLKDRKGELIYEGDILKDKNGIGFVVWSDCSFWLESPGSQARDLEYSNYYNNAEVIGNIYENPELIT